MIELRTGGKSFQFFIEIDVDLRLDTIASTFSFLGVDTNNSDLFKTLKYTEVEVWFVDNDLGINELLLTGQVINTSKVSQKKKTPVRLAGYSKPGKLEDVNIPIELYPLQRDNVSLAEIAKEICDRWSINLKIFDAALADANIAFEKVSADPEEKVKQYLSGLCNLRNLTLSHDNRGRLLIYKILNSIEANFRLDSAKDSLKVTLSENGQAIHSECTVIKQATVKDTNSAQATAKSPFSSGQDRPIVKKLPNGEQTDVERYANAVLAREAKNIVITIEHEGWTIQNKLIRAGFYIELTDEKLEFENLKLIVQSQQLKSDKKNGKTMTMTCVLPCVYTGVLPKTSPFK